MGAGTWHYGVVARWWAEFNLDGPEIEFFRPFVEAGQPALDLACGTGRLLVPYLHAGLDVDGCDVSDEMLALCRERCEREGVGPPRLYAQAIHELDLPRRYRTIVLCGGFGLATTREQDEVALRRIHEHLEPGGTLVLDNHAPYAMSLWRWWPKRARAKLPSAWHEQRRVAGDGTSYKLRTRVLEIDPLAQSVTLELDALMRRGRAVAADERHLLRMNLYFAHELRMLLERAGFSDVVARAGYEDRPPEADDDFVVYSARRT
jgi:SAM-dependent methyltransferase